MRQSEPVSPREAAAGSELAAKLDALSRPLAERILGRAIELQHEDQAAEEAASRPHRLRGLEGDRSRSRDPRGCARTCASARSSRPNAITVRPASRSSTAPKHVRGGIWSTAIAPRSQRRLREYLEAHRGPRARQPAAKRQLAWAERAAPQRRTDRVMESITTDQKRRNRHLRRTRLQHAAGRKRARPAGASPPSSSARSSAASSVDLPSSAGSGRDHRGRGRRRVVDEAHGAEGTQTHQRCARDGRLGVDGAQGRATARGSISGKHNSAAESRWSGRRRNRRR